MVDSRHVGLALLIMTLVAASCSLTAFYAVRHMVMQREDEQRDRQQLLRRSWDDYDSERRVGL